MRNLRNAGFEKPEDEEEEGQFNHIKTKEYAVWLEQAKLNVIGVQDWDQIEQLR